MSVINIAGDCAILPKEDNQNFISIPSEMKAILYSSDYNIVNFEAPIKFLRSRPILKSGPNINQDNKVIDFLIENRFDCVTLANNHFRDFGDDSIAYTIEQLQSRRIDYVGGGNNNEEASHTLIKSLGGIKFAFINCCEQEWSIATEISSGSNPLNPIEQYYAIQEVRNEVDFVIVIVHGGIEHYQLPTPEQKRLYHFFIDSGADVVINHHQHCYSGYENYKNKLIFYGLGNFIFPTMKLDMLGWHEGYLVELTFNSISRCIGYKLHPYIQSKEGLSIRLMNQGELIEFKSKTEKLNSIISDDMELKREYDIYLQKHDSFYDPALNPYRGRIMQALYRRHLLPRPYSVQQLCYLYDVINCDSHRNRFIHYLKKKINA